MSDDYGMSSTVPGRVIVLPMIVFAAAVISIAGYWLFSQPRRRPAPPPSIAVLPFDAPDRETGRQIALGIMEKLSGIPDFHVAPREDAFPAKGADVRVIGERLNVRDVLDGSIDASGRVTARLINTSDGFQFWSRTYDSHAQDLAAIEDQIAQAVIATRGLKNRP